ncbi:(d)CMP kinase [Lactococcus garvieae subsp. garvieae]|jgi:cytidylate kinase|uniref:Cytidylate kinase n=3 Tax=Lactococcus garvieae TaxID=1363 RepID=F9VCB8_LACGL|nr:MULTISPECIES: (d)CMP kinase [Lactococcus]ETD04545.1 cytidylate kinase [Lactococcus garvieae TRF1]MDN5628894.1 (d)CMP kinase [Lactococcus sp.]EIT66624.1 Cytidylate kinase (CK) (Cytidine monophosphate kinase) [Lactococcus garvieae IPLA 31405]EOT31809.1 cytidylate kinase [Lactococcus garvieae ATCC 49156]EOT93956.1 cytidylate kinase [Lactococcus garvieae ATCC 49156]
MIKLQIAVDGPASSGKSTVAKIVAQNLGIIYLDTGAMYRAATLVALQNKTEDPQKIIDVIKKKPIFFKNTADGQLVFLGTEDITKIIRTNEVTQNVSKISALAPVREFLVAEQQRIADEGGIIMDGRDIGTVVLPHADLKIFLVASVDERAERRYKENIQKNIPTDLEELKVEIAERDRKDSTRAVSPLKQAEDAILLDSTGKTIDQVAGFIEEKARELL